MSEEDLVHLSIDQDPLHNQIGGNHYKECSIQPVEYIHANNLDYLEGNVIKYITRHRTKGDGKKDVEKAIHYAQLIIKLHYPDEEKQADLFNDLIERGKHVQVKS
jgi:hypothetical protein|tara:strand:+ start:774 stop:1088 length:315 start_codon:yes stop_codon:yes gene_type:complete